MFSLSINHDEKCKIRESVSRWKKLTSFPPLFKKYFKLTKATVQFSKKSGNSNIITKEKTQTNKSLAQQSSKSMAAEGVHKINSCLKDVDMVLSVPIDIIC